MVAASVLAPPAASNYAALEILADGKIMRKAPRPDFPLGGHAKHLSGLGDWPAQPFAIGAAEAVGRNAVTAPGFTGLPGRGPRAKAAAKAAKADSGTASGGLTHTLVGVLLQLIACITSACGLLLQRASAYAAEVGSKKLLGVIGVAFCIVSSVPDMLSYIFAPQSLLALMCCFEPLLVSALGLWLLPGDMRTVTKQDMTALGVGVMATVACAAFAPSSSAMMMKPEADGAMNFRIFSYGCIVLPAFGLLMMEEHVFKRQHLPSTSHYLGVLPATLAALSLAVQRLTLAVFGVTLQSEEGYLLWAVLKSPVALISLLIMAACALNCLFHVCKGTQENPPHLFMLAYCAISAALQLIQSICVLREYRDEPVLKVLCSVLLAGVSLGSVAWMHAEHTARLHKEEAEASNREAVVPLSGAIGFLGMMRMSSANAKYDAGIALKCDKILVQKKAKADLAFQQTTAPIIQVT